MIHVTEKELVIIKNILKNYKNEYFVFGSRATGLNRKYSDLDICFTKPMLFLHQALIKEAFEESNLPYTVDFLDFNLMSPEFQNIIKKDMILLKME